MRITFLRSTSPTRNTCPTLYATERGTFIVQGKRVVDPGIAGSFGLLPNETMVEVPARLLAEVAKLVAFPVPRAEQGSAPALVRAVPRDTQTSSLSASSRESFIVRGLRVIDPEALAAIEMPDDETAAEVPRDLLAEIRTDAA